jgi:hypothetical protein
MRAKAKATTRAKDFSRPSTPRLRITMTQYTPDTRSFKSIPDSTALVNATATETRRLWEQIEGVIGRGSWRDARTNRAADPPAAAAAAVS